MGDVRGKVQAYERLTGGFSRVVKSKGQAASDGRIATNLNEYVRGVRIIQTYARKDAYRADAVFDRSATSGRTIPRNGASPIGAELAIPNCADRRSGCDEVTTPKVIHDKAA